MAPDDKSGAKPAGPVVLRIKLRYDDLDAMVQRFASNVGKSGLFLPTRTMQPLGTEVKFELRLANDTPVLVGLGRVKHVRPPDPANPRAAFGLAIELMRVTREGREVIIRMIERRRILGLPEVAIPLPEDVDSARRADMDSQPRADTSGIVREAMAQMASAPVAEQILTARSTTGPVATAKLESGPVLADSGPVAAARDSGPIAAPPSARDSGPIAAPPSARDSGPIAKPATFAAPREAGPVAKPTVAALAPEPPRKQRPRLNDLIAKAESGPIAAAPAELDEHVDVERALSRARALATGDLDVELAALRESAAAPIEISVEAASAELARQLGGSAIARRDRSARWAPPPAITPAADVSHPADVASGADAVRPADVASRADAVRPADVAPPADVVPRADLAPPADVAPAAEVAPAPDVASAADVALERGAERDHERAQRDDARDDDDAFAASAPGTTTAIDPGQSAHRSFAPPGADDIATDPAAEPRPPALVVAEHEHDDDEDAELAAFERAVDGAIVHTGQAKAAPPPAPEDDEEIEELDSLDVVPDDELPSESTQIGATPVDPNAFQHHGQPTVPDELAARLDAHLDAAEREADEDLGIAGAAEHAYQQPGHAYQQPEHAYQQPEHAYQQPEGAYAQGEYAQGEYAEQAPGAYAPGEYAEQAPGAYAHGEYAEQGQAAYAHGEYAQPAYGEPPAYAEQPHRAQPAYAEQPHDPYAPHGDGYAGHGEFDQGEYSAQTPEDEEEISDVDVLAEADAEDADLLTAHGEQEASGEGVAAPAAAPARGEGSYDYAAPGYAARAAGAEYDVPPAQELGAQPVYPPAGEGSFDFAARLDLGDDESNHARSARPIDPRRARSYGDGYDDGAPSYAEPRRAPSYGEERYDYDAPSSSYTFAERPGYDGDPYAEEAPAQLTPIASPPLPQPSMLREPPPQDYDLENALEALDVDLDELSPAVREHRTPLPGLPTPHAKQPTGPVRTTQPTGQVRTKQATGAQPPAPLPRAASEIDTSRPRGKRAETPARALAAAKPVKPKRAATEDDGVLIDFDDDDE